MIKCYRCGWEGNEEGLVKKPDDLHFDDYVAINTIVIDATRSYLQCPICNATLMCFRSIPSKPDYGIYGK